MQVTLNCLGRYLLQVGALTNLQRLSLRNPDWDSCESLTRLVCLERLEIIDIMDTLPGFLSQLTGLRFLALQQIAEFEMDGDIEEATQILATALPHLHRLTHLVSGSECRLCVGRCVVHGAVAQARLCRHSVATPSLT